MKEPCDQCEECANMQMCQCANGPSPFAALRENLTAENAKGFAEDTKGFDNLVIW